MKNILPIKLKDGYKVGHKFQYPADTTLIYSNLTPRGSRVEGIDGVVAFGFQYFIKEYLINQFNRNFFSLSKEIAVKDYKRRIDNYLGPDTVPMSHIEDLWDLGYLPLCIKAVPEGTIVPFRVPVLTIRNTHDKFFWVTNMLETILSNLLWMPMTSATTALLYRRTFERYADFTGGSKEFIDWQGHDFSMRGMAGLEAACLSGAAHLLSFTGTDTIPAIDFLEEYYGANSDKELIGGSVPATEHSVMSMGLEAGEQTTFNNLLNIYPDGILSVVSDTWDLWEVIGSYLPALKDKILARNGKLVIRPDSGDPADIICGKNDSIEPDPVSFGVVECLWNIFGGTVNEKGYKTLDSHIGVIYGDSITPERQIEILRRLADKGFASDNVELGIGSYNYQYVTRDTFGFAMKATYGETTSSGSQAIFKKPKTDDGLKDSAKGLLSVVKDHNGKISLLEDCSWADEGRGILQRIFYNGKLENETTLSEIRGRLKEQV